MDHLGYIDRLIYASHFPLSHTDHLGHTDHLINTEYLNHVNHLDPTNHLSYTDHLVYTGNLDHLDHPSPYFSYRTFLDMYETPFARKTPYKDELIRRLRVVPLLGAIHLASNYIWPFDYVFTDAFYNECSVLYRIWYTVPAFLQFRSRIYIGLRLSEGVCIMAGLGCYPVSTEPKPARGPTKEFHAIKSGAEDNRAVAGEQCNYVTVYSLEFMADFERWVRPSMKHWNMSVQYWLAAFVYHRFPIKAYRILAVFVVSAYWHGFYAGYYITLCSVPMYLVFEDKIYKQMKDWEYNPTLLPALQVIAYVYKISLMGYWAFYFRLLSFEASWRYTCSVYFLPYIISLGGAHLVGLALAKTQRCVSGGSNIQG
ncbi:unnamed protein product [Nesidiocoris tenuis]|uniref:Lysophospholipid acyltransferase 7 n=1 Tax=Nesidiocoris tenuis TaxID=355587 RepID=A0A6H5HRR1_9HEMI|nr:unnamed protein product [Nesidiocoris tenuis]